MPRCGERRHVRSVLRRSGSVGGIRPIHSPDERSDMWALRRVPHVASPMRATLGSAMNQELIQARPQSMQCEYSCDATGIDAKSSTRSALLDRIITAIRSDLEANPVENCVTVTLGDYFDRGPDSRGVIERLLSNPFPSDFIPLKGNHELLFESFLRQPAVAEHWRRLGGLETLASYGVPVQLLMRGQSYVQAAEALKAAVPQ